jgi:GT2 family glycosyltransferase
MRGVPDRLTIAQANRAPVPTLPIDAVRPLWSVMIPTYNCADYLREALTSVLAQDPGQERMQIEVVDDSSTHDDPAAVVAELGKRRVGFFRQRHNVGHVANFNTALQRSHGQLIHLLHGDDRVEPGFYAAMERAFAERPDIGAAFCRDRRIDESGRTLSVAAPVAGRSGVLDGWLATIAAGQRLQAPAMVVRREVYEALGGFDRRISCYGEDWEMWVRIAAHYPVWYETEPLAAYRIHTSSLTARGIRTGAHAEDYRRVIEINRAHLPGDRVDEWSRAAKVNFARACMRRGWRALRTADAATALAHFREGVRTSVSWPVLAEFGGHGVRFAASAAKRLARAAMPARSAGAPQR